MLIKEAGSKFKHPIFCRLHDTGPGSDDLVEQILNRSVSRSTCSVDPVEQTDYKHATRICNAAVVHGQLQQP